MHTAIFSDKERKLITDFVYTGFEGKGFRVLKHRINKNRSAIFTDYNLITKFDESQVKHNKR